MRHYFALGAAFAIPSLPGGVMHAAAAAALIPIAGAPEAQPSRVGGTPRRTVPLPAIADAA